MAPLQSHGQGTLVGTQLSSPSLGCAPCLLAYKMSEAFKGTPGPPGPNVGWQAGPSGEQN